MKNHYYPFCDLCLNRHSPGNVELCIKNLQERIDELLMQLDISYHRIREYESRERERLEGE